MINTTSLSIPSPQYRYILHTDASDLAIGATLMQETPSGKQKLVEFYSKILLPSEFNYTAYDKELPP